MDDTYLTRETLVRKLKDQHDEKAWEDFVFFYHRFIYSIIRQMNVNERDSEDLSQNILLKIWEALPKFDYQQRKGSFRKWIFLVTRNTVINYFSKNKQSFSNIDEIPIDTSTMSTDPEIEEKSRVEWETHVANLAFARIRKSVSEKSLSVFERVVNGEKIEDIARDMDLAENTVYVYKNRIRDRLIAEIRSLNDMLE